MWTTKILCLLLVFFGIFCGQAKAQTPQQFIPCNEYSRNCYPGIERCHKNQLCTPEPWIVHLIACLTSLALAMIMFIIYYILKDYWLFYLILAIAFAATALGFLVATICFAVIKEASPTTTASESGIMKTDLMELVENESETSGMTTGTTDLSFLKVFGLTTLSLYIFIAVIVVLYYCVYICRLNMSTVELKNSSDIWVNQILRLK